MRLTFLGTSAGTPTRQRNVTSQVIEFEHGPLWVLDCGEGTQQQALQVGIRTARIERILVTHLHGDHCLGLPGLLAHIGISGRTAPVSVIGPPGIREYLDVVHRLTWSQLPFRLDITEMDPAGGRMPTSDGWTVLARPLVHRVPCLGYILVEDPRPGKFHQAKADALGIPPRQRGELHQGRSIVLADGRRIDPLQVADPARPGRRLVLLGDTSDPSAVTEGGMECDLLVCEATYDQTRAAKALEWGHMTTTTAGQFATRLRARHLAITHFSGRYGERNSPITINDLIAETAAACPGIPITAAADFASLTIAADGHIVPGLPRDADVNNRRP